MRLEPGPGHRALRDAVREFAQSIVKELLGKEPFHLAPEKVRELDKVVLREAKEFGMEALPAFAG